MATRTGFRLIARCSTALLLFAACWTPLRAVANEHLYARIDQAIERASFGGLSPLASDGEFLRRIYLDLAGMIPPADEARAFLDDDSPDKRAAVVERLLNSSRYVRHMANVLDVILMERRGNKHIKANEWQQYLRDSVAQNKPWNQLARELLAADGTDAKIRAAVNFYLEREAEPNLLTRDVGRVFFGMDLQCCQCHDHPVIDHYYQADYFGIFAFLNRGFLFTDKDKKVFYAEKAEGDVEFTSVFTDEHGRTRPRLPGDLEITEPVFGVGDEYQVKPAGKTRPVPKYSRRAKLSELATNGQNQAFNRNIVNRLWAHMMGRGLVSPLDLQHFDNPPAHPELLDLLATDFVSLKYDVKEFLRQLALTRAYQRSLDLPGDFGPQARATADQLAQFEADYAVRKQAKAKVLDEIQSARKEFNEARDRANKIYEEFKKAGLAVAAALKKSDEAAKKLAEAKQRLVAKQEIARSLREAAAKAMEAAAKLSDDPELTQAAATFQSKADELATEVAAAQKSVDDVVPIVEAVGKTLDAARANAAPIQQRLEQANAAIDEVRGSLLATGRKLDAADVAVLDAKILVDQARIGAQHVQLVAAADRSQEAYRSCQADLATSRETLRKGAAELPHFEAAVVAAQQKHDVATSLLRQSRRDAESQAAVAKVVAEAATSAEVASQKLPDDAELKQATESVKSRSDQVNSKVAELEKVIGQRQQEAELVGAQLAAAQQTVRSTKERAASLQQKVAGLAALLSELEARAAQDGVARDQSRNKLRGQWSQRYFTASLDALTPEQMAWSVMQASGVLGQQQRAAETEIDEKLPLDEKNPDDPTRLAERERARGDFVYGKVKGNVDTFVKLFGHAAGQPQSDFFATVDQALFFANAGTLQSWLSPGGGNLTDRLNKLDDPEAIAEELYISVLTRRPSEEETAEVAQYVQERPKEKIDALKEMTWGLITSAEFRFSH